MVREDSRNKKKSDICGFFFSQILLNSSMSEPYPEEEQSKFYFITLSTTDTLDLLHSVEFKHMIIDSLKFCIDYSKVIIHAWCLIPSHLHMIVYTRQKDDLHDMVIHFKSVSSKKIVESILSIPEHNRKILLDDLKSNKEELIEMSNYKVWEEKFYFVELKKHAEIKKKLIQIHSAPVTAGIADEPEDYWYSSARNYVEMNSLLDVTLFS